MAALDPASIDQRDADTVSTAVLTAMWSVDTTTDHDQRDAALRAAGWLSPEYLAELRDGPQVGTDAAWATWAAHRARTRASLTEGRDTRPPDTATQADRQWQLTVTPHRRRRLARRAPRHDGVRRPRTPQAQRPLARHGRHPALARESRGARKPGRAKAGAKGPKARGPGEERPRARRAGGEGAGAEERRRVKTPWPAPSREPATAR
ncbi:hypothetical protein GCM10020001_052940 [Nonomuraea salmonea]